VQVDSVVNHENHADPGLTNNCRKSKNFFLEKGTITIAYLQTMVV
jgi:oligoribonuclease (3'-5' exoribonuclease)